MRIGAKTPSSPAGHSATVRDDGAGGLRRRSRLAAGLAERPAGRRRDHQVRGPQPSFLERNAAGVHAPRLSAGLGGEDEDALDDAPDGRDPGEEAQRDQRDEQLDDAPAGVTEVEVVDAQASQEDAEQAGGELGLLVGHVAGLGVALLVGRGALGVWLLGVGRVRVGLLTVRLLGVGRVGVARGRLPVGLGVELAELVAADVGGRRGQRGRA